MDIKHDFKKLRNAIFRNGPKGMRLIVISGKQVKWSQLEQAYRWDRGNSIQIHHILTNQHIHMDSATKMRKL